MIPEILSPAGNPEKLAAALRFGADAVYLAGNCFGMRASAANFTLEELAEAVSYAHNLGKKIYLTVNTMPREYELPALETYLEHLKSIPLDALIIADFGVLSIAKRILPHIPVHVSTQAGCVNSEALTMWQKLGASRVVLARELTLEEIKNIRRNVSSELELECFVHGSMCVSWSGRCLLSNYLTGRDSNRGMCAQPCRWEYTAQQWGIVETKRPDILIPVEEHNGETFFMSSRDMCMVDHMDDLLDAGITSLKIEGRMKSAYYTAVITNAYRMALDDAAAGRPYNPNLMREVESVSHRTYGTGYYYTDSHTDPNITEQSGYIREKAYLATVLDYDKSTGEALCVQRNKYVLGDGIEILTPGKCGIPCTPEALYDEAHNPIPSTPHAAMKFYVKLSVPVQAGDIIRGA